MLHLTPSTKPQLTQTEKNSTHFLSFYLPMKNNYIFAFISLVSLLFHSSNTTQYTWILSALVQNKRKHLVQNPCPCCHSNQVQCCRCSFHQTNLKPPQVRFGTIRMKHSSAQCDPYSTIDVYSTIDFGGWFLGHMIRLSSLKITVLQTKLTGHQHPFIGPLENCVITGDVLCHAISSQLTMVREELRQLVDQSISRKITLQLFVIIFDHQLWQKNAKCLLPIFSTVRIWCLYLTKCLWDHWLSRRKQVKSSAGTFHYFLTCGVNTTIDWFNEENNQPMRHSFVATHTNEIQNNVGPSITLNLLLDSSLSEMYHRKWWWSGATGCWWVNKPL